MRYFVAILGKFFAKLVILLPRRAQFWIGDLLGLLWFDVLRIRRQVVLDNLLIAFPEMNLQDRTSLGRRSVRNMCRNIVDYCYFHVLPEGDYSHLFKIEGLENLEKAQEKNLGVCMLSMHLGNGDNAAAGLALAGQPVVIISKEFKVRWLNDMWFGMRARLGTEFIPPRNSSFAVLKALKRNKNVVFVNDQFMGPPVGVRSTFFGKETGSAMGLAVMAQRSGSPIIPVSTYRRDDGVTVIVLDPEIPFEEKGSKEETILHMTQVFDHWTEKKVRQHPDQWMWVHRRWKEFHE
ncbi:MAG: lipid A biosynthesis lauroyl acyltransferase [Bdellovibrionales bacterium]|nr:lipid A biosynthesis lauroyl acyltransferase [Bdellovibrionales bacterium]